MAHAATDNRGRRPRRVEPTYHPFFKKQGKRKVQYGYRVCWYVGEERKRTWVASEKEALDLVESKRAEAELRRVGVNLVPSRLTAGQVQHAERAFDLLDDAGFLDIRDPATAPQLLYAINWFLEKYTNALPVPTVAKFIKTFAKSRAHRDRRTREDYASCHKLFVEAGYGHLKLDEVQSEHIRAFLDSRPVGPTTKKKYYAALRALFYLACSETEYSKKQWLKKNPVLQVTRPTATTPRRVVYTLKEIKDLIQVSLLIGCAPVVILRPYTMLRADEAVRFLANFEIVSSGGKKRRKRRKKRDPWSDIDLANSILRYHEPTDSRFSRDITIYPVLKEWLELFRAKKSPCLRLDWRSRLGRSRCPKNSEKATTISSAIPPSRTVP